MLTIGKHPILFQFKKDFKERLPTIAHILVKKLTAS